MVCLCWSLVVVMAYVSPPGFGSVCLDSSFCSDLSNEVKTLNCIHLCMSVIQANFPELSAEALNVDNDDELLLRIILATLASKDKISGSDLKYRSNKPRSYSMEHFRWGKPSRNQMAQPKLRAQNNQRRSYTMEHFRWGKPSGDMIPKLKAHSNNRRSYTMEHFRWGKPPGRKRRPLKFYISSLDGGDSFYPLARRQLSEDEPKWDLNTESHQKQRLKRSKGSSKAHASSTQQDRKDGTYRMSHFRWGNPHASKRNEGSEKLWEKKPQGQPANVFRDITVKDVQRLMGQMKGREEVQEG